MSLLLGGGNKAKPQFTGLSAQTSTSAVAITICWGQNRLAPNIIWEGDFKAHKQKQGKGGGKSATTYTYSASFQLGLCWGEIHGVVAIWKDNSKVKSTDSKWSSLKSSSGGSWSFALGTTPQSPWGYLTTKHPDQAIGYAGIAHADISNYDLGQSNTLGQHSFEVQGLRWDTASGGGVSALDADPALIVEDFLTDPGFGLGFDLTVLANLFSTSDAATTGDGTFQTYCRAMSFGLSPCLTQQASAGDTLGRWAKLCNSALVWNGYQLKVHPYGPDTLTANGVTYVPEFPVRYVLTDADFTCDNTHDPVTMDRVDPADAFNSLSMIIANRANDYNDLPVPWRDQGLVDQFGLRKADNLDAKEVTELAMAEVVVSLIGQRQAYIRNSFQFSLPIKYFLLEPMDVVTIVDPRLGTFNALIQSVEEDEDGNLAVVAEEYIEAVSTSSATQAQSQSNTPKNTAVDSGPSNPPVIFEPPASLSNGTPQLWVALSGGDGTTAEPNWGGAIVWISTDNIQYVQIGTIENVSRMGKTTAALATYGGTNPDTGHTLSVNLAESAGELEIEATSFDASTGSNLCYVDGELIAFEVPTLTGSYAYDLTNLWRGMNGSTIGAHASGSDFVYLDDAVFKYDLPANYIGQTLYLKFQSDNVFGMTSEVLSDVAAYTFTPSGASYGTGPGGKPSIPTGFAGTAGAGFSALSWTANAANDNVTGYEIWRATGASAAFGAAAKIATTTPTATNYKDATATPGTAYTYFLVAINVIGSSTNTAGQNVTPSDSAAPQPFGFAFQMPGPVASKPVAFFDTPIAWTAPASLGNSQGSIGDSSTATAVAPSAQTDFDIQSPPGTSIGTMRFASGSLTATFIKAADTVIPVGQATVIVAPATLNGIAGTLYGSIKGTR